MLRVLCAAFRIWVPVQRVRGAGDKPSPSISQGSEGETWGRVCWSSLDSFLEAEKNKQNNGKTKLYIILIEEKSASILFLLLSRPKQTSLFLSTERLNTLHLALVHYLHQEGYVSPFVHLFVTLRPKSNGRTCMNILFLKKIFKNRSCELFHCYEKAYLVPKVAVTFLTFIDLPFVLIDCDWWDK